VSFQEVHGFKTHQGIHGRAFLLIESDRLEECLAHLKIHPSYGVGVSRYHGFTGEDLEFMKDCPAVEAAYLQDPLCNASGLYHLSNLNWLLFSGSKKELDLSPFAKLEALRAAWSPNLKGLDTCRKLRHLALWKFKPKTKDLMQLTSLERLIEIEITQSPIESLSGLGMFSQLQRLELSYLSKLKDISALKDVVATLKVLRFDRCKAVKNYAQVRLLKTLKELGINHCGVIPTISLIRDLPNLEHFSFVETNVFDGDLTACVEHPRLKHVGFMDKRHYSHRFDEVKQLIGKRT
jgi:hypothetical protein